MNEFVKADSTNLPNVENIMILEYLTCSDNHNIAEIRGAKAILSSRNAYVDSAVGYVELKRMQSECFLRCKVVPEHRVSNKQYIVTATIKESEEKITKTSCDGCAASAGGCKHTLVFLFWLNKRSTEPPSTSVECYWRKPNLSTVRLNPIKAEDIFDGSKKIKLPPKDPNVYMVFLNECKKHNITNSLATCFTETRESYNIFDMTLNFLNQNEHDNQIVDFAQYKAALDSLVEGAVEQINKDTVDQVDSKKWHSIRQGRITASKLYEASRCTTDGTLVQQILGGYKVPETAAIKRGKRLEPLVLKEAEKQIGKKIEKSGFILIDSLVGASPDGISDDFVIEVKCPVSKKTLKNYLDNGEIKIKVRAQIQAQMLAANKEKGVLCVADPSFEQNKKIHLHWIKYEKEFTMDIINKAMKFWEQFVFGKIITSARC